MAAMIANSILVDVLLSSGGKPLEPNKQAVTDLNNAAQNSVCALAPYPATVADNPNADVTQFPFTTIFSVDRNFGIYHQKISILHNKDGFFGYCGGIDFNSDRLDDANHLNPNPFHDVHLRFQGPAVRDLALTFEERWTRDGTGALAFPTPAAADLGTPGQNIVQVARTYFKAADALRALPFAPQGDRTLANTLVQAIQNAQEYIYIVDQYFTPPQVYRDALVQKVTDAAAGNSTLKKLIVALPSITDQPFGEHTRSGLISDLFGRIRPTTSF